MVTGLAIAWIRPGQRAAGAVVVIALVCGSAPMLIDAFARSKRMEQEDAGPGTTFTTVVRLGTEPPEVARTSIILAARVGPTAVATTGYRTLLDELGALGVRVHVAATMEAALLEAARATDTDAIMILSASAFPLAEAGRAAAGRLHDGVGWVTGHAPSPNNDRYAPYERELLAERLRSDARTAGATLWEPDATVVRTDLVVAHPIDEGRPWGRWLRGLAALGYRGIEVEAPIALRAAPADAPGFWPSQMMRTRATAAELAGATTRGPARARLLAAALLMRELYAWPLAAWALIPLMIGWSGSFPFSCPPGVFVAMVGVAAAGRWSATRLVHGVGLHPVHDARAAAYAAPGSLLALVSAVSGRIRPRRVHIPDQPLLYVTLAFTCATTLALLDRAATSDAGANVAAGAALANLVLLWMIAIRAVGQRGWDRTVYRLEVDLPAVVDGRPARIVAASPIGLAVRGSFADVRVGSSVTVAVSFAGMRELTMRAAVASRRAGSGQVVLGLALALEAPDRVDWIEGLFAAARNPPGRARSGTHLRATHMRATSPVVHTLGFRLQMLLVGTVSVFAASTLSLVLLGFRPLVISSGSMRPTLHVGDVVVTSWARADRLQVGDIVTFDDHTLSRELVTHRVRSIVTDRERLRIETRGDANTISEQWTVTRATLIRRTVWTVPGIGGVLSALGAPPVREGLFAGGLALLGGIIALAARGRRRSSAQGESIRSTEPLGDADPKKRAVPNAATEPSSPSR